MGLESPTGCSFTSIKSSSMVKLESLQLRLSNVKSIVSSERRVLRRERIAPVMTVNGSLLPQSMAYIIVGTHRYLKEVPELIKIGFNAWRSSSSSYQVVQGIYIYMYIYTYIHMYMTYVALLFYCLRNLHFMIIWGTCRVSNSSKFALCNFFLWLQNHIPACWD